MISFASISARFQIYREVAISFLVLKIRLRNLKVLKRKRLILQQRNYLAYAQMVQIHQQFDFCCFGDIRFSNCFFPIYLLIDQKHQIVVIILSHQSKTLAITHNKCNVGRCLPFSILTTEALLSFRNPAKASCFIFALSPAFLILSPRSYKIFLAPHCHIMQR